MNFCKALQQVLKLMMSSSALQAPAFRELSMGSIQSAGWIDAELQTSLSALAGQLQTFYGHIQDGTFTGGKTTYSALNEAQPYYFQAAVAAVFTTDAPDLRQWVDKTMNYFIDHQTSDGFFGPPPNILWPRWPILLGAMHYAEAVADNAKVIDFIYNFVNASHAMLATGDTGSSDPADGGKSGIEEWGAVRTAEYTMLLQWLYERHPRDDATQKALLNDMTLVRTLGNKKIGDNGNTGWTGFFQEENFNKDGHGPQNVRSHGVNVAMALKEAALKWRVSGKQADQAESRHNWDITYKYHGKAAGHFAADEHLAGFSPDRGAETCQIVENMWSSSVTYAIFGEGQDADRAEMLAFNSLPAAMTGDWWGRQYLQQENQLSSQSFKTNPFASDGPESNIFGLQTNYPCCTVNHPQGLPRFVSRAYLLQEPGAKAEMLLHAYMIPSKVQTVLSGKNSVTVVAETNYPFEDQIRYTFTADQPFTFGTRVPGWAKTAVLQSDKGSSASSGLRSAYVSIAVPAGTSHATYSLTADVVFSQTPGGNANSVSVTRGALLYSLPLAYTTQKLRQDDVQPKAIDNLRLPKDGNAWKVAIDTTTAQFNVAQGPMNAPVFDDGKAPVSIAVQGCNVPDGWDPIDDGAWNKGFPPSSPACAGNQTTTTMQLQPYGASKLRVGTLASLNSSKGVVLAKEQQRPFAAAAKVQRPFLLGRRGRGDIV